MSFTKEGKKKVLQGQAWESWPGERASGPRKGAEDSPGKEGNESNDFFLLFLLRRPCYASACAPGKTTSRSFLPLGPGGWIPL